MSTTPGMTLDAQAASNASSMVTGCVRVCANDGVVTLKDAREENATAQGFDARGKHRGNNLRLGFMADSYTRFAVWMAYSAKIIRARKNAAERREGG